MKTDNQKQGAEINHDLSFDTFCLSNEVRRALEEMGYAVPTAVQDVIFKTVIDRKDLIVQSQTGTGKTAAFGIPIIDRLVHEDSYVQVLILAPTRELALQSANEMKRIGKYRSIHTAAIYGGAPMQRQINQLEKGVQVVSGTPGRVLDHLNRGTLDLSNIRILVLDEMDEMLSMGFARELNSILEQLPQKRQTLCFSATVDETIQKTAEKYMNNPDFISLSSDIISPKEVTHFFYMVTGKDRTYDLTKILQVENPESAIIFCNLRSETEIVAHDLQKAGFKADWLNGDLPQGERERVMSRTRKGELKYLVATDVAARGIDVSHLTHIINYTFPESVISYVHRTGRTGRAGKTGTAISLVCPKELGSLYYLRLEYKIYPIERSLPTKGEMKTKEEIDRIELLDQAFEQPINQLSVSLARRLLTHPNVEHILSGLLETFFGVRNEDVQEEATSVRHSQPPNPASESQQDTVSSNPDIRRSRKITPLEKPRSPREYTSTSSLNRIDSDKALPNRSNANTDQLGTLYLNIGRKDGLKVGELARFLRNRCNISRSELGRIRIRDRYTLIGIPNKRIDEIVTILKNLQMHDKQLEPERAKIS